MEEQLLSTLGYEKKSATKKTRQPRVVPRLNKPVHKTISMIGMDESDKSSVNSDASSPAHPQPAHRKQSSGTFDDAAFDSNFDDEAFEKRLPRKASNNQLRQKQNYDNMLNFLDEKSSPAFNYMQDAGTTKQPSPSTMTPYVPRKSSDIAKSPEPVKTTPSPKVESPIVKQQPSPAVPATKQPVAVSTPTAIKPATPTVVAKPNPAPVQLQQPIVPVQAPPTTVQPAPAVVEQPSDDFDADFQEAKDEDPKLQVAQKRADELLLQLDDMSFLFAKHTTSATVVTSTPAPIATTTATNQAFDDFLFS